MGMGVLVEEGYGETHSRIHGVWEESGLIDTLIH